MTQPDLPSLGRTFLEISASHLSDDYFARITACVNRLSDEQIWWRPNESSNSVGNLVLHLAGNVGQWVVSGVGGAPDTRIRHEEFDSRGGISAAELLERLERVVEQATTVLRATDPESLLDARTIQGRDTTVLGAIVHAVEHFSMHTGQIIYIAKLLTDEDAHFYSVKEGIALPSWEGWGDGTTA